MVAPDQIRGVIAESLQVPMESLTDDLSFGSVPEWDSVNHISLMLALETAFDLSISDDDVIDLTSVGSIVSYVARMQRGSLPER